MAEVVSTGVSHMCDNSTVSVNNGKRFSVSLQATRCNIIMCSLPIEYWFQFVLHQWIIQVCEAIISVYTICYLTNLSMFVVSPIC